MYLIEGHYSHIILTAALALWLVVIRPAAQTVAAHAGTAEIGGVGLARVFAWLAWAAAAALAANDVGWHLNRAALNVPNLNLEATLTGMSVWPVVAALVIDRLRTWRNEGRGAGRTGALGTAAAVTIVCLPMILILLFIALASIG